MGKFTDLSGQKYNRLTFISVAGRDSKKRILWNFKCDCGNELVAIGTAVKFGNTKSCGCIKKF